jgi:hypothetical protein
MLNLLWYIIYFKNGHFYLFIITMIKFLCMVGKWEPYAVQLTLENYLKDG